METFVYKPKGVCSTEMRFQLDGDVISGLEVINGCNGNLKGISALVKGRTIDEVIGCLDGIKCGFKQTSCPDQMAQALKAYKAQ
ncbi:MAG: TIGR03905 family TSCPD domain-containing protein [Solobacterium sp.]|nr:TIGR03905 family TSCPD domain-containing protein [Solobacterium sp.]